MEAAYQPELWQNLYIALCGASAALTGLLFISTALHVEEVMKERVLRNRASHVTTISTVLIIEAGIILLPQSYLAIGAEIFVLNLVVAACTTGRVIPAMIRGTYKPLIVNVIAALVMFILGMAGGLSLWMKTGGGLYLITAHFFLGIGVVVRGAWGLMVDVGTEASREVT